MANIVILFISSFVLTSLKIWCSAEVTNPVCNSTECKNLADIYLKNMKQNGNPCIDFYEYACHGWAAQHPRPAYEQIWNVEGQLEHKAIHELQKLLTDKQASGKPEFQQAKTLYKACMNLPLLEKSEPSVIKNIMTKVGTWPMFFPKNKPPPANVPWWQIDNEYIKVTGQSALFSVNVAANERMGNRVVAEFKRLDSAYGALKRTDSWRIGSPERKHYYNFLMKVIERVAPQNFDEYKDAIDKELYAVLLFRDELDAITHSVQDAPYETLTIKKFQEWYDKHVKYRETVKTKWLEVVHAVFRGNKDPNGEEIKDSTISVRVQKPYLEKLANFLGKKSKRDIVNHIHLYFAERYLSLTPELLKELEESYSNNIDPTGRIRHILPRSTWCVSTSNMLETLWKMYVDAVFPQTDKPIVNSLINEAKYLLEQQIMGSTWLSREWKLKTADKIRHTTSSIGYPDWMDESSVFKVHDSLDVNPLRADAYYVTIRNRLHVCAAFLQTPNYNRNTPPVINYGTVTAVFGHELYHALDHKGLQYNAAGGRSWWPKNLITEFDEHSQCFKQQYDSQKALVVKKYKHTTTPPSTVDEDIADVMGLKLAYQGYKNKLLRDRNVCEILPGFEKFGCEKLFFIAFANTFCSTLTPAAEERVVMTDAHSLPRIRLNGAVANMKEFSDAFKCKKEDPLNEQNRCDIWKVKK